MTNHENFEFWSSGNLMQAPADDVVGVPWAEDADLAGGRSTARIEANSLRMTAFAEGNTQADMPGWMAVSIGALHVNIGREHGVGLHEDKTSPGFHGSPIFSSQADFESEAEDEILVGLDSHNNGKDIRRHFYLWRDESVRHVGEDFETNSYFYKWKTYGKMDVEDFHFAVYTNFVLTGSDDIEVKGHDGEHIVVEASGWSGDIKASSFYMWNTDAVTFSYVGNSGNNTFNMTWGFFTIDLSVGGDNKIAVTNSVARQIIGGGGNDEINITGHAAAANLIDLRNGGDNEIYTEVWADIIGGAGNDTIESQPSFNNGYGIQADLSAGGDNTVTLWGAASTVILGPGNDTIKVANQWNNNGHPGNWSVATIDLSLGGTNRVDITGDTHTSGPTVAHITLGKDNDTIIAHDHTVVRIFGANSTGNHTITLNGSAGRQGEVRTGQGHTDLTLTAGVYDIHLGSGSVSMSVNGRVGFSKVFDADGNLIVGRLDGQSSVAEAVHTFSAGESVNLQYSLQLGHGVDKVQFYANSGHYQVTSSDNADLFQLDFFGAGGTEEATFEVFDFKWGTDRIMAANGLAYDEYLLTEGNTVRLQYMGEENGQHAFDVVAVRDFGAYDAGHVWMTVYSRDLPDLNFL